MRSEEAPKSRTPVQNSQKLFDFVVILMDTGLPYPDKEAALKDAEEWAREIAVQEMCTVAKVEVKETE